MGTGRVVQGLPLCPIVHAPMRAREESGRTFPQTNRRAVDTRKSRPFMLDVESFCLFGSGDEARGMIEGTTHKAVLSGL